MQAYSDPTRAGEVTALPDVEVFHVPTDYEPEGEGFDMTTGEGEPMTTGYYWWPCFPECLPDGEPTGPFETAAAALADARGEMAEELTAVEG